MKTKKQVIIVALAVSILLMLIKFVAYFITQSNAILTDAAESIVNVIASSFAFYSIYLSSLPKDQNHPYGHGKVEFFSAFVEGTLIILAGIIIIGKTVYNFFFPQEIHNLLDGSFLIGITGIINGVLGWLMIKKSTTLNSITIQADGKHLMTDAVSSFGLVMGLLAIWLTGIYWLDSLISFLLAFYIIRNGYKLTRVSVGGLMDESDIEVVKSVIDCLDTHRKQEWIDIHNLRTQRYGESVHIDCHITLPYYFDLVKVHQEVSNIDKLINKNILNTELFIHADPCLPQCCHYCNMQYCPVRKEPKSRDIKWTLENVTRNKKHFESE